MKQTIRIDEVLNNGDLCNDCFCLLISNDSNMIGKCIAGYWLNDSQWDLELSATMNEWIYIRPKACIKENNTLNEAR